MSAPNRLYKFVPAARVEILETGLIRFTQPSALNDPFEFRPLFERLVSESDLQETLGSSRELLEDEVRKKFATLPPEQQQQFPVEVVIAQLRANPVIVDQLIKQQTPAFRKLLEEFTPKAKEILTVAIEKHLGILSLSEDLLNPLLWAHYADAHRGFALEFDANHPFFDRRRTDKDEFYHLRKVTYAHRTSEGRTLVDITAEDLLLTKAPSWSYEAEWRMLVPLDDAHQIVSLGGDQIYLFAVPVSAITSVVLGARCSEALRDRVKTATSSGPIRMLQAALDRERGLIAVHEP
jgi:hypothetical protein